MRTLKTLAGALALAGLLTACGVAAATDNSVDSSTPTTAGFVSAPTTTIHVTDAEAQELAETICDGFETMTVEEVVGVIQMSAENGVTEADAVLLTAMAIAINCPEQTDQFTYEVGVFYPEHVPYVTERLTEINNG